MAHIPEAKVITAQHIHGDIIVTNANNIISSLVRDVRDANISGKKNVLTQLPIIFNAPGITNQVLQREIWCRVIERFKARGYDVYIDPRQDRCYIFISWESAMEAVQARKQYEYIASHTRKLTD